MATVRLSVTVCPQFVMQILTAVTDPQISFPVREAGAASDGMSFRDTRMNLQTALTGASLSVVSYHTERERGTERA